MNSTELDRANIENLTALWKRMGVHMSGPRALHNASLGWPNRHWFDPGVDALPAAAIDAFVSQLADGSIVPVWGDRRRGQLRIEEQLIAAGVEVSFAQTAMYLDLDECTPDLPAMALQRIGSRTDIRIWTDIASEAFGYAIDLSVIERLSSEPAIQLLLGFSDGRPAATAMLYKTAEIIGVHQVGVAESQRGKGIGYSLMSRVIELSRLWRGRYIALQASEAGEGLYRRLGFQAQFGIRNYQVTKSRAL